MNQMMRVLVERGFSIHIMSDAGGLCEVVIRNLQLDKSARGINTDLEKALAEAMLNYIDGHGRIE